MSIEEMIKAAQRAAGLTGSDVDGKAGPRTWAAILAKLGVTQSPEPSIVVPDTIDPRSAANIATLLPHVRPYAVALIQKAAAQGIVIRVISGTRTREQQDALFAQGRTTPGRVVTNARFGYSNHNFGIAWDVGVFSGTKYLPESPAYKAVGALGRELGIEWGGDWKSFKDEPHFQLRPAWARGMKESQMLAELRGGRSPVE